MTWHHRAPAAAAGVGPQSTFVLPAGILDPGGENTLAIAVISGGTAGGGLGNVSLTSLATMAGGVPPAIVFSPRYTGHQASALRRHRRGGGTRAAGSSGRGEVSARGQQQPGDGAGDQRRGGGR